MKLHLLLPVAALCLLFCFVCVSCEREDRKFRPYEILGVTRSSTPQQVKYYDLESGGQFTHFDFYAGLYNRDFEVCGLRIYMSSVSFAFLQLFLGF